jgi:hypothetical protein
MDPYALIVDRCGWKVGCNPHPIVATFSLSDSSHREGYLSQSDPSILRYPTRTYLEGIRRRQIVLGHAWTQSLALHYSPSLLLLQASSFHFAL